ncbi:transposase [Micromonospora sp. NPDC049047]|uniref:IS110 family transposase n=1 Tax=Micromonospora sp. NPDC049047 TaxID=3155645 RepID=UPI0033E0DF49
MWSVRRRLPHEPQPADLALLAVMAEVSAVGRPVCWAVDVTTGLSALLLTLLWRRQVQGRYVSGTVAFHLAAAFAGENQTDARDAVVIAQTIRLRSDIPGLLISRLRVSVASRARCDRLPKISRNGVGLEGAGLTLPRVESRVILPCRRAVRGATPQIGFGVCPVLGP